MQSESQAQYAPPQEEGFERLVNFKKRKAQCLSGSGLGNGYLSNFMGLTVEQMHHRVNEHDYRSLTRIDFGNAAALAKEAPPRVMRPPLMTTTELRSRAGFRQPETEPDFNRHLSTSMTSYGNPRQTIQRNQEEAQDEAPATFCSAPDRGVFFETSSHRAGRLVRLQAEQTAQTASSMGAKVHAKRPMPSYTDPVYSSTLRLGGVDGDDSRQRFHATSWDYGARASEAFAFDPHQEVVPTQRGGAYSREH